VSRAVERAWERDGVAVRAMTPLSWLFRSLVAIRNLLFDLGVLRVQPLALPSVSVGNLSVGGTGKTPVAAWVASELRALGAKPAIVMRGYGDDEPLVHKRLNPDVPVITNSDRVAGAREAKALGATVIVLDDAFQHRRAARDVDLVLISAEQGDAQRLLPAGPLREGRGALRRATAVIVTRKSASLAEAEAVAASWTGFAGAPGTAVVALTLSDLRLAHVSDPQSAGNRAAGIDSENASGRAPLELLRGQRVLAVSAIGNPESFERQLTALGAVVTSAAFPDHHPFSAQDAAKLAADGAAVDHVLCTLKDAVKLAPLWPRGAPLLWYLSQAVEVERGEALIREALRRLVPGVQP
jgi:tetraacyldisaccharide 4'-kinase